MRIHRAIFGIAAMCLLFAGCGDSTGPEGGSFEATISGDMELSVDGDAIFGVTSEGAVDRWMIFLENGRFLSLDYDMIGFLREGSDTPISVGTHTIAEATSDDLDGEDITGVYWMGRHNGTLGVYTSVSGTLTITSSDAERVVGNFSFSVTVQIAVVDVSDVRELTVTGSFEAAAGTIPSGVGS